MKYFDWDTEKNRVLKEERDVGFEDALVAMEEGGLLDVYNHPNQSRYPEQKIAIVKIKDYVYLLPYIEDDNKYFLKTIFPSRKMTQKYIMKKKT